MMEYERLTEKKTKACTVCRETRTCPQGICWRETIYNRLQELEDKIENGTLKELPENSVVLTEEELFARDENIHKADREYIKALEECINNRNAKTRKETVDKFAERLEENIYWTISKHGRIDGGDFKEILDEVYKEITGEEK